MSTGFDVMFPTAVDKALLLGEMLKRSFSSGQTSNDVEVSQLGSTESLLLSMQLPQLVETSFWAQLFQGNISPFPSPHEA